MEKTVGGMCGMEKKEANASRAILEADLMGTPKVTQILQQ